MWSVRRSSPTKNVGHIPTIHLRSNTHNNMELQFFMGRTEALHPPWWTRSSIMSWFGDLVDDTLWNSYICGCVLVALIWTIARTDSIYIEILDVIYNISYAIHIFAVGYKLVSELENNDITFWIVLGFLIDLGSFAHYVKGYSPMFKLLCYFARLYRPYKYLWSLNDYNLKGSILGTTLKYVYIFIVVRIIVAYIWLQVETDTHIYSHTKPTIKELTVENTSLSGPVGDFLSALYIINKMFIPIGPSEFPDSDVERLCCLFILMMGCLVVTGSAVATLALVVSLYMRPEETFRARYKLIMQEMKDSQVPASLRYKVETFYKMYWHKQRGVSETKLLPRFPPTLPTTINIDIYFEATQKARILRDLSYQLLSELARKMVTIHYIPGDSIINRGSRKCRIIYITYGDVEMLTAEDDSTAILRMTRGTVLTPSGCAAAAALGQSHLAVRAATFCTAHVLPANEVWRVVAKHSVSQDYAGLIRNAFREHIEKVKTHYIRKIPDPAVHKSSILNFNRNLMALKEMTDDTTGKSVLANQDVFLEIAGCYIIRNRPDATLTDHSDEICLRATFPCILQPSSSLLIAWNGLVAILILAVCIAHPYYLVYKKTVPLEFRFFDYVMTAVFTMDHFVHLSTGANVEEGVPITFRQTSAQQMRSAWFVLDVVATLPLFEFIGTGHFAGINKILRLPKLFRVLKSAETSCVYHSNVLRFLSYTLLLLIACYIFAAIQQFFMCYQSGYCVVTNLTHPPFWDHQPLDEETVETRLAFSLYWAISVITFTAHKESYGEGDWRNVLYTLGVLEICIVLRIFMEAVYSATIMVTTALREAYDSHILMVKSFLIRNEVDPLLMERFITYLHLCWYTDKAYKMTNKEHSTIFYDLPPHVFQDIVGRNRSKYILTIPFMKFLKRDDLSSVSSGAKLFYTSPNEILLNTGELTNEMYVIKKGICEVIDPITRMNVGWLTSKHHFGALLCLLRLPSYFTVRAVTHVQVICISRMKVMTMLESPQIQKAVAYIKQQPEFHRLQTGYPSFLKYEAPPPPPNTMRFRLPRKHEPDTEFLLPFTRLGVLSILRYIFPRFTIRPDGKYLQRYEWFRVTCALLSALVFPHYTYLVLQWPHLYYVTLFLDITAYYDIVQRMLVGYFNQDGILVYHPSSTAAYYLKGAFLVDLLACLALENLEAARRDHLEDKYRLTASKQFLMLNRLIQLYRLPSAMKMLKNYIGREDIFLVLQAIPLFMAMLNVLTCMMVMLSVNIFYSVDKHGSSYDWLIEPLKDHGGSWLILFGDTFHFNMTETPWNLHLTTYFWVVYECSTTGFNVFNPSNLQLIEVLFIGMASSTMIITYYSVRIISVRANVNKSLANFQQNIKDINVYMAREKIDSELQRELHRYYNYNWEKMGGLDYRGVLKLCDQMTLRTDAILHIYGPTFAKCPLLANADVSLLRIVGRSVRSVYFLRDMKIIDTDDMVSCMYFVDYGGVEVVVEVDDNVYEIVRLPRGSVFGNIECTKCRRSSYMVMATGRLHLLMIKSEVFSVITKDFPALQDLMSKSQTGIGQDNKMYILGADAEIIMRRNLPSGLPARSKKNIIKYIYFQEGLVQIYLIAICMSCIYLDIYNAGFQVNSMWMLITLYSLDLCFFMKIFTQHSLPFLVTSPNMRKLMLPIRSMYFKREFRYDLFSIMPFELLCFAAPPNAQWMWFSWLRLNRTYRITTVSKCLQRRSKSITVNLTVTTIMGVVIWFTLFVHASTCVWYFIGMIEDSYEPRSSWMHMGNGSSHCMNHYICSMYFIITTFAQNGIGDIMPKNHSEVIFVSILQIVATMIFMVYVGEFSNMIQFHWYRSFSFYSKYLELQEFMKNNRVSENLMTIVNKYTLHLWRENRGVQVPEFLHRAPLSLRLRIMSAAYLHHITRHHIFEECEPAFLRQLVGCMKLYTYNEGMYVVKASEITNSMYVIHTGRVRETCVDADISARVYPAGSYFGILQGLLRNSPYTHSYQTMIKSQVLTLNLDDWEYLLKHYPESKKTIHKHMRQVGDNDSDHSNWPGGPPDPEESVLTMLSGTFEMLSKTVGQTKAHPRTTGSSDDKKESVPETDQAQSRRFERSKSLRDEDDNSIKSFAKKDPVIDTIQPGENNIEVEPITSEPKKRFFKKIASTAKKIMGRLSEPEVLIAASDEGKDELFLEEDEETTEALLKQFEEAKNMKTGKNVAALRKKLLNKEQKMQKQMFAEETSSTTSTQPHEFESQSEMVSPSAIDVIDVLHLGNLNSRLAIKPSVIQATIDLSPKTSGDLDSPKTTSTENPLIGKASSELQAVIDMSKPESTATGTTTEEEIVFSDSSIKSLDSSLESLDTPLEENVVGKQDAVLTLEPTTEKTESAYMTATRSTLETKDSLPPKTSTRTKKNTRSNLRLRSKPSKAKPTSVTSTMTSNIQETAPIQVTRPTEEIQLADASQPDHKNVVTETMSNLYSDLKNAEDPEVSSNNKDVKATQEDAETKATPSNLDAKAAQQGQGTKDVGSVQDKKHIDDSLTIKPVSSASDFKHQSDINIFKDSKEISDGKAQPYHREDSSSEENKINPNTLPSLSVSDIKLPQGSTELRVGAAPPGEPDGETSHIDLKDEGTLTSKQKRRYIHVRYEENQDAEEILANEEIMPPTVDRSAETDADNEPSSSSSKSSTKKRAK